MTPVLVAALLTGLAAWLVSGPSTPRLRALGGARLTRWRLRRPRRVTSRLTGVAECLDLLAVCLESGLPLSGATVMVAEVMPGALGTELARVAARYGLGQSGGEAWAAGGPGLAEVAREVQRAESSGIPLGRTLRELAEDLRRESSETELRQARRVGVRSVVPLMACFLPAFILVGVVPIVAGLVSGMLG